MFLHERLKGWKENLARFRHGTWRQERTLQARPLYLLVLARTGQRDEEWGRE